MHEKMTKMRARLLRDRLGVDVVIVGQIEEILRTYDPQRHELHKKKHLAHQTIRELLHNDSNDQAAFERVLADMRAAHVGLSKLRTEEMDRLAEILTPKQQAKLALAFKRMKQKMHKFRKKMRGDKERRRGEKKPGCNCSGTCGEP